MRVIRSLVNTTFLVPVIIFHTVTMIPAIIWSTYNDYNLRELVNGDKWFWEHNANI